jgi:hypothetical protein
LLEKARDLANAVLAAENSGAVDRLVVLRAVIEINERRHPFGFDNRLAGVVSGKRPNGGQESRAIGEVRASRSPESDEGTLRGWSWPLAHAIRE